LFFSLFLIYFLHARDIGYVLRFKDPLFLRSFNRPNQFNISILKNKYFIIDDKTVLK